MPLFDLLRFSDGHEIAVIYYRTGYAPDHFNEEVSVLLSLLLILVIFVLLVLGCNLILTTRPVCTNEVVVLLNY